MTRVHAAPTSRPAPPRDDAGLAARCEPPAGRSPCAGAGAARPARVRSFAHRCAASGLVVLAAAAAAGCAASRPAAPDADRPPDLAGVVLRPPPDVPPDVAEAVADARRLAALGRRGAAFRRLEPALRTGAEPQSAGGARPALVVEAERLLQDLVAGSRGDAWIRLRADAAYRSRPGDADAAYLRARVEPSRRRAAELFDEALRADPAHPWARMGRAISLERSGDAAGATREAWRVAAEAPWLPLPWLWLGATAWRHGSPEDAEAFLRAAVDRAPADAPPWTALAAALDDQGRTRAAARAAVEALRRAPGDPRVLWGVGRLLERGGGETELADALAAVEPARTEGGDRGAVEALRGRLLVALGRFSEAEEALVAARRAGASAGEVAVPLRRARFGAGRAADAVSGWLAELPVTADPADARAPAWAAVAAAAGSGEPRTAGAADALAAALDAAGWGREAADVVGRALARWPGDAALRARAADLAAWAAFLDDLARVSREHRRAARRGTVVPLDAALAAIREASVARLGADVTEGAAVRSFPLLGSYAASTESSGAFRDAFDRRGLLLVVGARAGRAAEMIVGRLVSHRHGVQARAMGRPVEYDEHVVETDGLPEGLAGQRDGLAGVTLDRFVLIQLDVVRNGPAPEDPDLPFAHRTADGAGDLRALDTPSDVARRIERSLAARGTLERDVFDAVVRHERVHVADAARMLPPWSHPLAAIGFAVGHGFDAAAMERTLEARAAVGALIDSDEPRAALAALVGFLPAEEGDTAHVAGYRAVVEAAVDEIVGDPDAFPAIDPRFNVVQQLDRLAPAECRELGRRLARRLWGD